jgi:hypothetical protein
VRQRGIDHYRPRRTGCQVGVPPAAIDARGWFAPALIWALLGLSGVLTVGALPWRRLRALLARRSMLQSGVGLLLLYAISARLARLAIGYLALFDSLGAVALVGGAPVRLKEP